MLRLGYLAYGLSFLLTVVVLQRTHIYDLIILIFVIFNKNVFYTAERFHIFCSVVNKIYSFL